jgi:Na+/proline symporter
VITTLAAVCAFMLAQLAIGVWASRRVQTEDDYLVAGRRLGYPLAIFSTFATWFGAETIVGSAGRVSREGVSLSSAEPFAYGLCLILMGLVFARPLWQRKLTTLADLFRTRYSTGVERLAALILIPSSVLWAAAQVRALGHVLTIGSSLEADAAIAIAAGLTIVYTAVGGMLADAVTDLVQGVLLVIGLVVLLIAAVSHLGGVDAATTVALASGRIRLSGTGKMSVLAALESWAIPVCGSVVATELVSRVIATRSSQVAQRATIAAGGLYITVGLIPVVIGLVGGGLVPDMQDAEHLVPAVARQLLPTLAYATFAGGLISAILSTVNTTLLVPAGLLSHNVIVPLLGGAPEQTKVRIARIGVFAFGIVAYVLALHARGVFALVEQASAFGSAGALVTVVFGLFTTVGGARTAAATLVVGVLAYVAGLVAALPYPFLLSLAASLATFAIGAGLESSRLPLTPSLDASP